MAITNSVDASTLLAASVPLVAIVIASAIAGYKSLQKSHARLSERVAVSESKIESLEKGEAEQNAKHDRLERLVTELKVELKEGFARIETLLGVTKRP